ncbi:MAG TPA: hypothetical protein VLD38_00850, partial [Nitrosopumilaceae archaeon]|nr:hypothetical protein [Nitrosopumilaceae archaeon]
VDSMNLAQGTTKSLDSKLQSIINYLNIGDYSNAESQLNAFINQVTAQTGKTITAQQATNLKTAAQEIIASLP